MNHKHRSLIASLCFFGLILTSTSHGVPEPNEENTHTWDNAITIPVLESPQDKNDISQIQLPANIYIPLSEAPESGYPAIIFINSWAMNETEYLPQARRFADAGYIVLSYTTRGFRGSPGLIDTAGPKDIADTSSAISWLIDNHPVNANAIALGGVSYGAGIALLTATQDQRVAAVISMSVWGSLSESLWGGETPQETWLDILLGAAGWPIGRPNPEIQEMADNMFFHRNIEKTLEWANVRSPIHYLEQVNGFERLPAVYVSNNLHDYLFQPNSIVEFLTRYVGPWRLDFNFGTHGSGEADGLSSSGVDTSYPWNNAKAWLDHHLKGEPNGVNHLSKVNTVVHSRTYGVDEIRESFKQLPVTDTTNDLTFTLVPQGDNRGTLSTLSETIMDVEQVIETTRQQVGSGGVTGALQGAGLRFMHDDIDPNHALIFTSETLEEAIRLRGAATLSFFAKVEHNSQFFAYLLTYSERTGKAYWIGHSPLTWHLPVGETEIPTEAINLTMEFYWTANDIDEGDKLLLVIDGKDADYWRYDDTPESNTIVFGHDYPAKLTIPRTLDITAFEPLSVDSGETDSARSANGSYTGSSGVGGTINWMFLFLACGTLFLKCGIRKRA